HLLHRLSSHDSVLRRRRPARLSANAANVDARGLLGADTDSFVAGIASRLCLAVAGRRAHGGDDGLVVMALVAASTADAAAASRAVRGLRLAAHRVRALHHPECGIL